MADQNQNDVLNRLVARVYRCLLQYTMECWPWTTATETPGIEPPEQKAVDQMAARQRDFIARLVGVLTQRGEYVDFGNYPDFSEMHYVSLDYLLVKLAADEKKLVSELEAALPLLHDDATAAGLVSELLSAEKEHFLRLREMATRASAPVAA
jgi:hypothetical protein